MFQKTFKNLDNIMFQEPGCNSFFLLRPLCRHLSAPQRTAASIVAVIRSIELSVQVTNDSVRLSEREADVAIRQTNKPLETLIGTRLTTVASAVYGSRDYCAAVKSGRAAEKWIGVDCCEYHRAWTKQAWPQAEHEFYVDETSLTLAALKEGLGVGFLPCFLGDSDPELARFREPEKQHELGLWLLYHRDLRNTKRVTLFREHMQREIKAATALFEGAAPTSK